MKLLNKGDFAGFIERPAACAITAPWFLVQVASGSERVVSEFLKSQAFDVYAPVTRVMKPVAQRHLSHKQRARGATVRRPKIVSLFPGYQFVRIDMSNGRWHDVFRLRGVRGLVSHDDRPAPVPDALITNIRSSEVDGVIPGRLTISSIMHFELGEEVRITDGPFAQFNARVAELPKDYLSMLQTQAIDELDESTAVTLLVNIFGRESRAKMTFASIEKI